MSGNSEFKEPVGDPENIASIGLATISRHPLFSCGNS